MRCNGLLRSQASVKHYGSLELRKTVPRHHAGWLVHACVKARARHGHLQLWIRRHGNKSNKGQFVPYGDTFGNGDVIGCTLDCVNGTISFSKNGMHLGIAFRLQLGTCGGAQQRMHPAVLLKGCTVELNLGAQPFAFLPPRGYNSP